MQVERFTIDGPCLITPPAFGDARGWFSETYNAQKWADAGVAGDFVQDNQSLSSQIGTLRGLHFQIAPYAQAKLVRVLAGAITDIIVDIRHGSATFGQHISVDLNAENRWQFYIPTGFAHGFITRDVNTQVAYKVSEYYAPSHDRGLIWNDPDLALDWGYDTPELSDKDQKHPTLAQYLAKGMA